MIEQYTATVKINTRKRDFTIETGSLITMLPSDERILEKPENKK